MRKPTREEDTIIQRVLNWDYIGGHDVVEVFPTDDITLFYGYKNASRPQSLLGVIDSGRIGIISISRYSSLKVSKRCVLDANVVLNNVDPVDIERNTPEMPSMFYTEFSKKPELMKELAGIFHDTYDMWRLFQHSLREDRMKRYFSSIMGKDLNFIQEEVTLGYDALLNPESRDPVHDFLMIVDSGYRVHRESHDMAMRDLGTVVLT
jgi:hypothetical protein